MITESCPNCGAVSTYADQQKTKFKCGSIRHISNGRIKFDTPPYCYQRNIEQLSSEVLRLKTELDNIQWVESTNKMLHKEEMRVLEIEIRNKCANICFMAGDDFLNADAAGAAYMCGDKILWEAKKSDDDKHE
jgi:hypothetical protein